MRTVLVTGGTGFIGRHLIAALLSDGWHIEVLTRNLAKARQKLPDKVHTIESLARASAPAAIVNLAGENLSGKRWSAAQKQELERSRQTITCDLVDFIGRCETPPDVLISGSAVGFYGATGSRTVAEQEPAGDEFQSRLCANWEIEALRARDEHGVRVCLIRTGIVLGQEDGALAQMLRPFKFGLGGFFGDGQQYMSWIHVRDEVGAILFLLREQGCRGAYNLTAPDPVTNKTFTTTLGRVLRRPAIIRMPAPALKLLLGEMSHLVLTGQRAVPTRLQDAGYVFAFGNLDSALRDLVKR